MNGSPPAANAVRPPSVTSPSSSQSYLLLLILNNKIPRAANITTPPTTAPETIKVFELLAPESLELDPDEPEAFDVLAVVCEFVAAGC